MVKISNKEFLEIGKICNTRGLHGEIKIQNYCDTFDTFSNLKNYYINTDFSNSKKLKLIKLHKIRPYKNFILAYINGIYDIDSAKKLKNKFIYAKKIDIKIPDDRVFIDDLIGFEIVNYENKKIYGTLKNIFTAPHNEIYEVEDINDHKKIYYIPILKDTLKNLDLKGKKIFLIPLKGIFKDEN